MKKINLIFLIAIAIIICGFGLRGKISGEKFDSQKWKTADLALEDNFSLRWDMMNSLRNNYDLIGMSKSENYHFTRKTRRRFYNRKYF
jgi:hypothetical protein